ncbi:MAG: outer membrane beta-barrel family protein, partial [Muribaculaceae bacterium]|nr:outer membrane beta-barrel family protein [Muribaculaceae bacterium]
QERMDVTMDVLNAIYSSSPRELREALVNRNRILTRQKGNSLSGNLSNETSFKFRNSPDALSVSFEADYKGYRDDTRQWQEIDYGNYNSVGPVSSQVQKSRLTGNPAYDFMIRGSALYSINSPKFTWSFGYGFRHERQRRTAERMMLEARAEHEEAVVPDLEILPPDYANTSRSRQQSNIHKFNGKVQYMNTYDSGLQSGVIVSAEYSVTGRRLDYDGYEREGDGDVFMPVSIPISKTSGAIDASVKYGLFKMDKGNLNLIYEVRTILPSLLEMVDLPNTSDPLNISMGNPDLKKATSQSLSLYIRLIPRKNSHVTFNMDGRYVSNDNTRGYRYDSATGVRTFRTYNTNGNWSLSPNAWYYLSFGPQEQLSLNTGIGYSHSRFANMIGEDAEPTKQTVLQDRYSAEASLDWRTRRSGLSGGAKVTEIFSHAVSGDVHVSYVNPFARFWVSIPGGLTLSSTYNVYLRSGMADRNMNRTRHLLNADLRYTLNDSWSFSVKAYDILGSVNNVDYYLDARGRTETVTNELPRYFLFSVSYNFNTKKK